MLRDKFEYGCLDKQFRGWTPSVNYVLQDIARHWYCRHIRVSVSPVSVGSTGRLILIGEPDTPPVDEQRPMSTVAIDYIEITLLLTPQSSTLWVSVIGSAVMKQL
jgi:hypothetical protein